MHSMRFIAVLDDCNDSKEAGNDQMQEEGEGERMRRRREEERKKGRKKERKEGREERRKEKRKTKEKRETNGEGREGEREKEREGEKERGRKEGRRKGRKGESALLASAVHVARAPYMNVTQDVAVGLSCILCTPTLEYPEYHTRLRPICLIFYENSK